MAKGTRYCAAPKSTEAVWWSSEDLTQKSQRSGQPRHLWLKIRLYCYCMAIDPSRLSKNASCMPGEHVVSQDRTTTTWRPPNMQRSPILFGLLYVYVKTRTYALGLPLKTPAANPNTIHASISGFSNAIGLNVHARVSDHQLTLATTHKEGETTGLPVSARFCVLVAACPSQVPCAVLPEWWSLGHAKTSSTREGEPARGDELLICCLLSVRVFSVGLRVLVVRRRAIRKPDLGPAAVKVLNARHLLRRLSLLCHLLVRDLLALERQQVAGRCLSRVTVVRRVLPGRVWPVRIGASGGHTRGLLGCWSEAIARWRYLGERVRRRRLRRLAKWIRRSYCWLACLCKRIRGCCRRARCVHGHLGRG